MPPSLVPRFAFADFAATVFACLPRRRVLTLVVWPSSSSRSWGHDPRALSLRCFRVLLPHAAFSYSSLSCCDCRVCARMGCCILEVEDVVKVSGPLVMLFDVLAVVDALGALLTAAAVLCFCLLGMKKPGFFRKEC